MPRIDVLALQETELTLNRRISTLLGDAFEYFPVYHDDSYWAKWVTPDRPYIRNGVGLALRHSAFDHMTFIDLPLMTGNHAAVIIAFHIASNQWFRIASVHFDMDDVDLREIEVETVSNFFQPGASRRHYIDVIAGDFNSDVDNALMGSRLLCHGFMDVHRELGVAKATHPEGIGDEVIDHVLIRGNGIEPLKAHTFTGDVMDLHPHHSENQKDARIAHCLEFNGSDHFAIEAVVRVPYGNGYHRVVPSYEQ
jgi:endonuclease/exonuclease/phosphatase family metal-dependent hydrolase